jgi:hypothetical protein
MPFSEWGTPYKTSSSDFFSLKSKGDKIRFRLIGTPFVDGKHFQENEDGSWTVTNCPRINDLTDCATCEKFFEIINRAKKTGDKKLIEQAKKDAKKYSVGISFYFPVIDRDTELFTIFKSKLGIKNKLETELQAGVKILDVDWVVIRTEKPGPDYYSLSRIDSSETKPLTNKELEEVEKYKAMNLSDFISGRQDEGEIAVEANVEVEG